MVVCLPEYGAPVNPVPDVVGRGIAIRRTPVSRVPAAVWAKVAGIRMSRTAIDNGAIRTVLSPDRMDCKREIPEY
jgi:hypothetical protein